MIAGQRVFVEWASGDGGRRDHSRHVDVCQAVGKVVNVHLDSVAGHLTFDSSVAGSNFLICHKIEGGGVLHK